jgi:hypothetical protein
LSSPHISPFDVQPAVKVVLLSLRARSTIAWGSNNVSRGMLVMSIADGQTNSFFFRRTSCVYPYPVEGDILICVNDLSWISAKTTLMDIERMIDKSNAKKLAAIGVNDVSCTSAKTTLMDIERMIDMSNAKKNLPRWKANGRWRKITFQFSKQSRRNGPRRTSMDFFARLSSTQRQESVSNRIKARLMSNSSLTRLINGFENRREAPP